jgi:hypothetical protein
MSKGISASISHLVDRVEALTPKSDSYHTFLCVLDASGRSQSLESRSNQNRLFDFKFQSLSQDDGQAGLSGRKRIDLLLRVRYDIGGDLGLLERMIAEDSSQLINSLKQPNYNFNETGIVSLIPNQASLSEIQNDPSQVGYLLNLPFTLLYLEE